MGGIKICLGDTALSDCTAATGRPGRQSGRGEGASGRWSTASISRTGCGDGRTEPGIGGRAGDGVFLVWPSGAWGEPMLPGGHLSVSTAGLVG